MDRHSIILYHRFFYDETIINGQINFRPNAKPNGVLTLLKNLCSISKNTVWVAGSEAGCDINVPSSEEIRLPNSDVTCKIRRVPMCKPETDIFYHKTCKEGFWPILHSFPEKYRFNSVDWDTFLRVNDRFAQATLYEAEADSVIWIHGFHLWMVPHFIRKYLPNARIAFFFHNPFPSPDIFNILHWRQQIVDSLLCCDFLSFDVPRYSENFVNTAKSLLNVRIDKRSRTAAGLLKQGLALCESFSTTQVSYKGQKIKIGIFPEGTNAKLIHSILKQKCTIDKIQQIIGLKKDMTLIFAPSRLDYIKGTAPLIECYRRFLIKNKQLIGKVLLVIVSVPPKEGILAYESVRKDIECCITKTRNKFQNTSWDPIVYFQHALSFEEMLAWFYVSNILWIPSLRDGMNIICKEFIAAKKGLEGCLILSEFAGASLEFPEAIITNPFSDESMDKALATAFTLLVSDQKKRMAKMFKKVLASDISNWAHQIDFLTQVKREPIPAM